MGRNRNTDRPKFSIVIAVYQAEDYLQETIDSLLGQTLDFCANVQLILVDDGSTDGSFGICQACRERYPDQVVVLRQENAGQAAARNNGLQYARGKYINFLDSDDKLAPDALEKVWSFFEVHEQATDMVAIPMHFFEGRTGEHWQNSKFAQGSRIIDLTREHRVQQTSASSAFFHSRVKPIMHFDEELYCSEDFKVNLRVLAEKQTLGVVADTKYFYRRRAGENPSTVQLATKRKAWYTMWFKGLCGWACEYFTGRFGAVPAYIQYAILCDLTWRIISEYETDFHQILTPLEQHDYRHAMGDALKAFDDEYLTQVPNLTPEFLMGLLRLKYDGHPDRRFTGNDILLYYDGEVVAAATDFLTRFDFISVRQGQLHLEGLVDLFGMDKTTPVEVQLMLGDGRVIPCATQRRVSEDVRRLDRTLSARWRFACDIPLEKAGLELTPRLIIDGDRVDCIRTAMGPFVPLSDRLEGDCFHENGWNIARTGAGLRVSPRTMLMYRTKDEFVKWVKLLRQGARKAAVYRMIVFALRLVKRRPIWLISDRVNSAGDNGEALYAYLRRECRRQVDAYFFVEASSADYQRLAADRHVLPIFSLKHRLLHLLGDCVLSSGSHSIFNHPFDPVTEGYMRDLMVKPFVFLQHGIIKDDMGDFLAREKQGLMGFVTSSPFERDSIVNSDAYGYAPEQVWLTGLPRFDRLKNRPEKVILIMPTWRRSLFKNFDIARGRWREKPGFRSTEFAQFYRGLLNHPRLLEAAEKYDYQLLLAPHPNLRGHLDAFDAPPAVRVVDEKLTYRELFARGSLLLTDYSSVFFDFAYLKKPVVYAQFDQESFYDGQMYNKGYFDYARDGFGPVCTDMQSTVDALVDLMSQDCRMPEKYLKRVESFFAYTDQGNSARVAEHVFRAMKERKDGR